MTESTRAGLKPPMLYGLLKLIRIHQWIKNIYVFAPLVFAGKLFQFPSVLQAIGCFLAFSLVSSFVYIVNDIFDLEEDRLHPKKKFRVLAAGLISPSTALTIALVFLATGGVIGFLIQPKLLLVLVGYVLLNIYYTLHGKHVVILDIFIISLGFVLRVLAGSIAIGVASTNWLILATFFLSLFLAVAKRFNETISLGVDAGNHRKVLQGYTDSLLKNMLSMTATASVVSYGIYSLDSSTVAKFGTSHLVWTVPVAVFGILRYMYLVFKCDEGGDPAELLLKDKPLLGSVMLWAVAVAVIIYFL